MLRLRNHGEVLHTLRVQMHFAGVDTDKPLEHFPERPLGAVAAIDKWG